MRKLKYSFRVHYKMKQICVSFTNVHGLENLHLWSSGKGNAKQALKDCMRIIKFINQQRKRK